MITKTYRLFSLHKIKSNALRRLAIVLTFPILFVGNVGFATLGYVLFWWQNQIGLFQSSKHYWNTSEKLGDSEPKQ